MTASPGSSAAKSHLKRSRTRFSARPRIDLEDLGDGSKLAPNAYTLVVSSTDHQEMTAEYELNRKTFSKHLENFIRDNGWQTYGEVVVEFAHSPTLHTGQFRARGAVDPDARPMPVPSPGDQQVGPPGPPPPRPQAGPQPAGPNRIPQVGAVPMTKNSGYDQRGGYEQGSYPPPGYGQQPYQPDDQNADGPRRTAARTVTTSRVTTSAATTRATSRAAAMPSSPATTRVATPPSSPAMTRATSRAATTRATPPSSPPPAHRTSRVTTSAATTRGI